MLAADKLFDLLRDDNPNHVGETLLLEIVVNSEAESGCFYIINVLNNDFEKHFSYEADQLKDNIGFEEIAQDPILNIVVNNIDVHADFEDVVVPVFRQTAFKKYCIGFLHLKNVKNINQKKIQFVINATVIFNQISRNLFIDNLLRHVNHPISFKKSREEYYNDLVILIATASRLPLIALREYDRDSDSLRCIDSFGFKGSNAPDFSDGNIPPIFREVINNKVSRQEHFGPSLDGFPELKEQHIAQFIVLPILVGDTLWGVLSFATKCDFFFTDSEILGLETIAHGVGVSINNYRNFYSSSEKLFQLAKDATLVTGLEIAQAVRHEAKNILAESQTILVVLDRAVDKKLRDEIKILSDKLIEIHKSLDKIKTATKPPERKLVKVNLKTVWDDAVEMLRGRLEEQEIRIKPIGNFNIYFYAYQDWLRHAFMNLLANSIDAYKQRSNKRNREISLSVSDLPDKIQLTYTDNAGGIEIQNLAMPNEISPEIKKDINRLIFEPNVTSKGDEGSGYGLYLTRLTIQEYHKGTINLTNYRGGVTFSIELSKNLAT